MTHPRHRRTLRAASLATAGVAACLLLAACGGSSAAAPVPAETAAAQLSPSSAPPPPAPASPAAAATAPPATTSAPPGTTPAPASAPASSARPSAELSAAGDVTAGGPACSLVTEQDATVALGSDPGAGQSVTSHGASQCQYGSFQTSLVLVNITPSEGAAAYDRMRNNPKLASAGSAMDIPGLGDRAFGITGHGTGSIWINKGDSLVLVMVAKPLSPNATPDPVLALATTVSGRL